MRNHALTVMAGLGAFGVAAGSARAAEILVTTDISTSETWTADNVYNLQSQMSTYPGDVLTTAGGPLGSLASIKSGRGNRPCDAAATGQDLRVEARC